MPNPPPANYSPGLEGVIAGESAICAVDPAAGLLSRGQEPLAMGENLTFAARFLFSLTGKAPELWQISAMNTLLVLYAEHEFNASTFSARVTASTLSDIYAAITTAIGTLKGPLHGG